MIIGRPFQFWVLLLVISGGAGAMRVQAQTAAAPVAPEKKPKWESSVAAGVTFTRGNSDTLLTSLTATTGKKWDQNELSFGVAGTYGETRQPPEANSTVNANSANAFMQYNRLFTERLYGYAHMDSMYDDVAHVKYRVSLSPGAGYYLIKQKRMDLSAEIGPGYVFQRLGTDNRTFTTLRVGEKFHLQLSDRAKLWETVDWSPEVQNFNNYIANAEIGIESDLSRTRKLTLRVCLQDTYNNVPATGRLKNDAKLVTAIAYKF